MGAMLKLTLYIVFHPIRSAVPMFSRSIFFPLFLILSGIPPVFSDSLREEPILPIPAPPAEDPRKIALGKRLFQDPQLSKDKTISCERCHRLAEGGHDPRPFSKGVGGALGSVNAPTVYNSGLNLAQFWDGRAVNLEEQVNAPLQNPVEMAMNWPEVLRRLRADAGYQQAFRALYPDGISAANVRDAIAAFERSLLTWNAPFDRWLRGDETALSPQALRGYELFRSYGCIACHQGANVGGNLYQEMGAMGDYFADRGTPITQSDLGRFNVTHQPEDRHFFKVPSLRLAVRTAPYFHDASAKTLEEAIRIMGRYQLGREIPAEDIAPIIAFLQSLVGTHPLLHP